MRRMTGVLSIAVSALLLAACASKSDTRVVNWQQGGKRAWVVSELDPNAPLATLRPCLANLSAADYASRHFVEVRYHHARLIHHEIAEVPPGLAIKAGDEIELWPADCSSGKLSRIGKALN